MEDSDKKHIELMGTVTVGPKGQVVIPVEVRDKMNIKPGDKLIALYIPQKGAVGFVTEAQMRSHIQRMGASLNELRSVVDNS
ncbi:MAG TPA: AbrB/MazE/SpoVT family DNA-binding domain-containing protein [Candidatus Saccharimonadales bacterium]